MKSHLFHPIPSVHKNVKLAKSKRVKRTPYFIIKITASYIFPTIMPPYKFTPFPLCIMYSFDINNQFLPARNKHNRFPQGNDKEKEDAGNAPKIIIGNI